MKFQATQSVYNNRYFWGIWVFAMGILSIFLHSLFYPDQLPFLKTSYEFFLENRKLSLMVLTVAIIAQINGYYSTQKSIKFLEILEKKLTFYFFNGSKNEFNYSDLSSIKIAQDTWLGGIFKITLKSGEIKKIRNKIKNKEQALEIIQRKLRELNIPKLSKDEAYLKCEWLFNKGKVTGNDTCERIEYLITTFEKLGTASGGWETLYKDNSDGRYWELTYEHSEMHGGGPQSLRNISEAEAKEKYKL